jgi:hypothetical protein
MSINYYAHQIGTSPTEKDLHIGQDAGGWEFLFRAYPERGLTTASSWYEFLSRSDIKIVAETGGDERLEDFWPKVLLWQKRKCRVSKIGYSRDKMWRDDQGYLFSNQELC